MLQLIVKKHCKILLMLSALCATHAFAPDGENPLTEGNVQRQTSCAQSIPPQNIWQKALDKATRTSSKQLEQFRRVNEIAAESIEQELHNALGKVLSNWFEGIPRFLFIATSQSLQKNTRLLAADRALQMEDFKNIEKEVLTEIDSIVEKFKSAFDFMKSAVLRQNKIEIAFTAEVYVLTEHMITGFANFCQSKFKTDTSQEQILLNVESYISLSRHEEVDMLKFRLILTEFYNIWDAQYKTILSHLQRAAILSHLRNREASTDEKIEEIIRQFTDCKSIADRTTALEKRQDKLSMTYQMLQAVFSSSPADADQADSTGSSASGGASVPDPTSETASTETGSPESAASGPVSNAEVA